MAVCFADRTCTISQAKLPAPNLEIYAHVLGICLAVVKVELLVGSHQCWACFYEGPMYGRRGGASDGGHLRQQLQQQPLLLRVVLPAPVHGALHHYLHPAHRAPHALAEPLHAQRPLQVSKQTAGRCLNLADVRPTPRAAHAALLVRLANIQRICSRCEVLGVLQILPPLIAQSIHQVMPLGVTLASGRCVMGEHREHQAKHISCKYLMLDLYSGPAALFKE